MGFFYFIWVIFSFLSSIQPIIASDNADHSRDWADVSSRSGKILSQTQKIKIKICFQAVSVNPAGCFGESAPFYVSTASRLELKDVLHHFGTLMHF